MFVHFWRSLLPVIEMMTDDDDDDDDDDGGGGGGGGGGGDGDGDGGNESLYAVSASAINNNH